jgi:hypothetical protein
MVAGRDVEVVEDYYSVLIFPCSQTVKKTKLLAFFAGFRITSPSIAAQRCHSETGLYPVQEVKFVFKCVIAMLSLTAVDLGTEAWSMTLLQKRLVAHLI